MTTALWLLGVLGLLGAFDTIYFHEIRGRLPARLPGLTPELVLHAARSYIYVVVFGTLPWLAWQGAWAVALGALLVAEIAITLADFVVEDKVRRPLGGLLPGERVTHSVMAIVYGAMLANLVPVVAGWLTMPTAIRFDPAPVPRLYALTLTALAAGTLVSASRDLYAVLGFPRPLARWPWRAERSVHTTGGFPDGGRGEA
jgi:hypothetical protein